MDRSRLLLLLGAVAAAVVVVVVLVVVAGGGGGSGTTTRADTTATGTGANDQSTFAGVPQHGLTLGDPKAPATLVVFEDPQCPFCRDWNLGTLPTFVNDYIKTGRLKLVYRGIPIIGENSKEGLRALYAAAAQNKLWDLAEALYRMQGAENSGWITDGVIRDAATAAGANGSKILAASTSAAVTAALTQSERAAALAKIPGTPTFVLQRPPALPAIVPITGLDPSTFETEIEQALR